MFNKLRHAMGAAMGSARSEGALQLVQTKEHLWHEWNKGCGMFGWGMTHGAVTKFVAQYGIDLSQTGIDPKTKLSKADLEKLFDEFAKVLLENGAVSFSKR